MCVSIPLEQGNVFRLKENVQVFNGSSVSIPLEQGNVFRLKVWMTLLHRLLVSIPLEQGNVFRLIYKQTRGKHYVSQSLWNRAMSFDVESYD